MFRFLKRLSCKHEDEVCLTNLHGDMIDMFNTSPQKIYRSVWQCQDCGRVRRSEYLNKNCNIVNFWIKRERQ